MISPTSSVCWKPLARLVWSGAKWQRNMKRLQKVLFSVPRWQYNCLELNGRNPMWTCVQQDPSSMSPSSSAHSNGFQSKHTSSSRPWCLPRGKAPSLPSGYTQPLKKKWHLSSSTDFADKYLIEGKWTHYDWDVVVSPSYLEINALIALERTSAKWLKHNMQNDPSKHCCIIRSMHNIRRFWISTEMKFYHLSSLWFR